MEADLLLSLSSFCRISMQARPVFSTVSRTFVNDVGTFVKHLQLSRNERTMTVLTFLNLVSYASAEAETRREQFISIWLLCNMLLERIADISKLYWQCEHTRRILRLSMPVSTFGVGDRGRSVHGLPNLASEGAKPRDQELAPASFFLNSAKAFHKEIQVHGTTSACCASVQSEHDMRRPVLEIFLPDCKESKDIVIFCTQMIKRRKSFRSCCVRRLDDCCHAKDLVACLTESDADIVFVQQSISKQLKETFIRQNVLFVDRLGRQTVDASEKTLRWTVFENFSDWFFCIRTDFSRRLWRCWATTTQHQFGLTLKLRIRHRPETSRMSTSSIPQASCNAAKKSVLHKVDEEVFKITNFGTGGDIEAFLVRNSFLAALLCKCADGGRSGGEENAVFVVSYKTVLRTLDSVCQLCRLLM
ncbi:hypothetical protein Q4I28_005153 [Leishmania naiffi]|uniref:Uncharacterized protein n=1 Tax=Leishmania naiffi TaxID=5678 RepID=A0AAW3BLK1_9TRYP